MIMSVKANEGNIWTCADSSIKHTCKFDKNRKSCRPVVNMEEKVALMRLLLGKEVVSEMRSFSSSTRELGKKLSTCFQNKNIYVCCNLKMKLHNIIAKGKKLSSGTNKSIINKENVEPQAMEMCDEQVNAVRMEGANTNNEDQTATMDEVIEDANAEELLGGMNIDEELVNNARRGQGEVFLNDVYKPMVKMFKNGVLKRPTKEYSKSGYRTRLWRVRLVLSAALYAAGYDTDDVKNLVMENDGKGYIEKWSVVPKIIDEVNLLCQRLSGISYKYLAMKQCDEETTKENNPKPSSALDMGRDLIAGFMASQKEYNTYRKKHPILALPPGRKVKMSFNLEGLKTWMPSVNGSRTTSTGCLAYENVEQVVNRMVSHDAIKNFIKEDERIVVFSSIDGARVCEKFVDLNVVTLTFSIANVGIHIAADNACWPVGYSTCEETPDNLRIFFNWSQEEKNGLEEKMNIVFKEVHDNKMRYMLLGCNGWATAGYRFDCLDSAGEALKNPIRFKCNELSDAKWLELGERAKEHLEKLKKENAPKKKYVKMENKLVVIETAPKMTEKELIHIHKDWAKVNNFGFHAIRPVNGVLPSRFLVDTLHAMAAISKQYIGFFRTNVLEKYMDLHDGSINILAKYTSFFMNLPGWGKSNNAIDAFERGASMSSATAHQLMTWVKYMYEFTSLIEDDFRGNVMVDNFICCLNVFANVAMMSMHIYFTWDDLMHYDFLIVCHFYFASKSVYLFNPQESSYQHMLRCKMVKQVWKQFHDFGDQNPKEGGQFIGFGPGFVNMTAAEKQNQYVKNAITRHSNNHFCNSENNAVLQALKVSRMRVQTCKHFETNTVRCEKAKLKLQQFSPRHYFIESKKQLQVKNPETYALYF